jgi:glycosyltransferase involved in cell wall biosynthesis
MYFLNNKSYYDISVICTAYNHEKFIERAILSIVNQKTKYSFQIILSDDASSDGTSDICKNLVSQFPDIIKYFRHENNIGLIDNYLFCFKKALDSKYIAYCDGDDYWIDFQKLEIQTSFMEKNPQFSLSYHDDVLEFERNIDYPVYSERIVNPNLFQIYDTHFISAPSIMARNFLDAENIQLMKLAGSGDIALFGLATVFGDIGYIDKKMSVYTLSEGAQTSHHYKNIEREFSNLCYILKINKIYKKGFDDLLLSKTKSVLINNSSKISNLNLLLKIKIKLKNYFIIFSLIPCNCINRFKILHNYLFSGTNR